MKKLITLVFAVAVLASCRGRETALTGSYGDRVVSGQVVMGEGVGDSSPAGVQVSVVGTGMSTTLGADGKFAFAGVPENAEFQFSRPDGISARIAAQSGVITVTANGAHAGRGRGAKKPTPQQQHEGVIQQLGTMEFIMVDSHRQTVDVLVTDTTVIRRGDDMLEFADLQVDDHVHVQGIPTEDGKKVTAYVILVQGGIGNGDDSDGSGGTTMTANGVVKSNDGSTLVVGSQPWGDVTVQTDSNTIVKQQGTRISVADIKPGWEVNTMGKKVDDHTLLARQIEVRGTSKK